LTTRYPKIVVYHHEGVERISLKPGEPVVIGRDDQCDHVFQGFNLSRRHAEFLAKEGTVWVRDLDSTNGTHVNGIPIDTSQSVDPDDEIRLGSVVVSVCRDSKFSTTLFGLTPYSEFTQALRSEVTRARTFRRSLAVLMLTSPEDPTTWVHRIPPLLREVDTASYKAPCVLVVLAEASSMEAIRIAAGIATDGVLCGVAAYPMAALSADELLAAARRALSVATPIHAATANNGQQRYHPGPIVRSPNMIELYRTAERVAAASIPILILGETGTGKELLARHIHERSPRHDKTIQSINCGAIPQTLIESVLFGHEKGSFTGADKQSIGVFQSADGGTILLDEIGELPLAAQVTLLRVLDNKTLQRVGSTQEVSVDVRVLASTNRNLEAMCAAGEFRLDLLYRINTMTLRIPPLRERLAEIQALAHHFIQRANRDYDRQVVGILPSALSVLLTYEWPGNIREIRNVMERAVLICVGTHVSEADLPERLLNKRDPGLSHPTPSATPGFVHTQAIAPHRFKQKMEACEAAIIREQLSVNGGNQTRAAQTLGIARRTLVYKIRSLGIRDPSSAPMASSILAEHTLPEDLELSLKARIRAIEERLITATLVETNGDHSEAARHLGLHKRTFDNKVRKMTSSE